MSESLPPAKTPAPVPLNLRVAFATDWFQLEEVSYASVDFGGKPYYRLRGPDGVVIVAVTAAKRLLVIRQFRPAFDGWSVELPAGAVDGSETPLEAAQRELLEETGFVSENWQEIGQGRLMMDRVTGRMHGFLATEAQRQPNHELPSGMEMFELSWAEFNELVALGKYEQLGGLGFIHLACQKLNLEGLFR